RFTAICILVTRLRTPNHAEFASASSFVESDTSELITLMYSLGDASASLPSSMNFIATADVVGRYASVSIRLRTWDSKSPLIGVFVAAFLAGWAGKREDGMAGRLLLRLRRIFSD